MTSIQIRKSLRISEARAVRDQLKSSLIAKMYIDLSSRPLLSSSGKSWLQQNHCSLQKAYQITKCSQTDTDYLPNF